MPELSFREAAQLLDPVRPPLRLRGLRGWRSSKDSRVIHQLDKGLWQMLRWRPGTEPETVSLRDALDKLDECEPVKFLWYNTWLMDSWTDPFADVFADKRSKKPKVAERRGEIGDAIGAAGYTIAALCEVWKGKDGRLLRERMASRPGEDHRRGPDGTIDTSSGLETITFSPVRISSEATREFWEEPADEWFATKGVLYTGLDLGRGCGLDLYTTHLTAGGKDNAEERWAQINELLRFIAHTHTPENVILIAGDFNLGANGHAYPSLIRKFFEFELVLVREDGRLVNYFDYIRRNLGPLAEQCRKATLRSSEIREIVDAHMARYPGVGLPFALHAMLMEPNLDLVSAALDLDIEKRPLRARDLWRYRGGWFGASNFGETLSNNPLKRCTFDPEHPTGYCDDYVDSTGAPCDEDAFEKGRPEDGWRIDYLFLADPNELHTYDLNVSRVRRRPFWRGETRDDMPANALGIDPSADLSWYEKVSPMVRAAAEIGRVPFYLSDHLGLEVLLIPSRHSQKVP